MGSQKKKNCFVIMPFGEKADLGGEVINFNDVYEYIIKEVIKNRLKLNCIRCDEIAEAGWIHRDMLEHIIQDDVVVVDITTLNPNVFYELGVRHALRKCVTVLIRKEGTKTPFNIRGLRMINYDLDIKKASQAQADIEKFIRSGLEHKNNDSIIYDVFPNLKLLQH